MASVEPWIIISLLNKILNFFAKIFSVIILKGLVEKYLPPYGSSYTGLLLLGILAVAIFLLITRK
ncbi:hypothetical protein [Pyrococcus kukulkanii]|uniref:Uncharacterized protein n=1 Tax=Pyrococcus kukulkanii TaxID=1609559 RepID=A0ABV4T9W9_9EURY